MKNKNSLHSLIQSFFADYLVTQRGVSQNTIKSYRDVVKLFIHFVAKNRKKKIVKITTEDLTVDGVFQGSL